MKNENIILTDVDFFKTDFSLTSVDISPRAFSSLTYRISGSVSISAQNNSFVSEPGSITIVPQGCGYSSRVITPGEMLVLHFRTFNDKLPTFPTPICSVPEFSGTFTTLFERAIRHSRAENHLACMADAYRLLSEAKLLVYSKKGSIQDKLFTCKEYIDSHICDAELRVADVAEIYGCSEVYLRRKFKEAFGISPLEYIKKRRIETACQLLETGLYSVTEVAMRSGFDSISYFSAEFHRMTGTSPKNYVR